MSIENEDAKSHAEKKPVVILSEPADTERVCGYCCRAERLSSSEWMTSGQSRADMKSRDELLRKCNSCSMAGRIDCRRDQKLRGRVEPLRIQKSIKPLRSSFCRLRSNVFVLSVFLLFPFMSFMAG